MDAVEFYSEVATEFHSSYKKDANRHERLQVFDDYLNRYAKGAAFAYDLGCGSGVFACELARRGMETIGIDGAPAMLAIAEKTARQRGLSNLRFQQHVLPIADTTGFRQADLITSSSAIEYFESISGAFSFLRKMLKDDGVVVFSMSNRDSISRKIARLIYRFTGRPRYLGYSRLRVSDKDIKAALSAAGLTYLEHAYFARADRFNRLLGAFLPARLSSNMIIVAARKEPKK